MFCFLSYEVFDFKLLLSSCSWLAKNRRLLPKRLPPWRLLFLKKNLIVRDRWGPTVGRTFPLWQGLSVLALTGTTGAPGCSRTSDTDGHRGPGSKKVSFCSAEAWQGGLLFSTAAIPGRHYIRCLMQYWWHWAILSMSCNVSPRFLSYTKEGMKAPW